MSTALLHDRIHALLARWHGGTPPSPDEINALYTDGCAELMRLQTERLRVKRRMRAALLDVPEHPAAAGEAATLLTESDEIAEELELLTAAVGQLRLVVESAQEDPARNVPRRRFRRD